MSRGELPATTPDWLNVDHRRLAAMAPGEGVAYFRASWELAAELNVYIEAVHRLSDLGAVFTHVGRGTSRDGFEAEWRTVDLMTVDGELISRGELFDEADLDAAITRFEQLHLPQARRLDNAANQVGERFLAHFAAHEWDAMAELLADDYYHDDHRSVVNAGIRRGRDAGITNMRAVADLRVTNVTVTAIATRGERLVLTRSSFSFRDHDPEAFRAEQLDVGEINADGRLRANVSFGCDAIDRAFAELDARFLAGDATPYAPTWSAIVEAYAALNRHEFPAVAPDWVNIDHRGETAFGPDDLVDYLGAGLDRDQDMNIYIEAVHRLNCLGAVITYTAHETSDEGFDAEWRGVTMLTVDAGMINRTEVFDEADLSVALARFEELHEPQTQRLEKGV